MPYCQLYYHFTTATRNRAPLLTASVEPLIYQLIRTKAKELDCTLFALNGVEDHIHIVVSIPPRIPVSQFIGQVKAFSAAVYNKSHPTQEPFSWQSAYGVFTFDRKRLNACIAYVEHQKEHHLQGSLIPVLERDQEESGIAEDKCEYSAGDDW